jgi:hypothetical protein
MLDLIGAVVGMSAVGVTLVALTQALPGTLARRLGVAAIAGAWVGLASGLGAAGRLAFSPDHPVPLIGVLFALPLLGVGVLALTSGRARAALMQLPLPILIGVNSLRVFGVMFLLLAASGRLSGPFPFAAGLGDIITGALALPLALRIARSGRLPSAAVRRWNIFGSVDLIVAVGLGLTSAAGSPLQVVHAGVGSEAMQYLPYCLVPTVLVPVYLITHAIVAARLSVARAAPALAEG